MADAELGVVVTVKGAKEGAADLDKFSLSAKGAATSTTELSSARAKAESQWTSVTSGVKKATDETTKLTQATTATGQSMGIFQRAFAVISNAFVPYGKQAEGAGTSLTHLAGAHGEVAKAIHVVHPLIGAMGGQLGGLSGFAIAARGGLAGLAIAIGGSIIVSLETAAEKVGVVKERLQALLGSGAGGKAFEQTKKAADEANTSVGALAMSVGLATRALERESGFKTITKNAAGDWEVMAGKAALFKDGVAGVIGEMVKFGQIDRMTATDAAKTAQEFITAWAAIKTGSKEAVGLTLESFVSLEQKMPSLAQAISRGLGDSSLTATEDRLRKMGETFDKTLQVIQRIAPEYAKEFEKLKLDPGVEVGWDRLTTQVGKLWATLGEVSGLTVVSTTLNEISIAISNMNKEVEAGGNAWIAFGKILLANPFGTVLQYINPVISAISTIISKIRELAAVKSDLIGGMNTGGYGTAGDSTGAGPSFDASSYQGDLGYYATGGTFKVGGSGAQTPVNFMGTPGEIVSVTPVGGNAGSVFQVGGLGGVDSTLVQFSATPGSTVTITPVGLTPPQSKGLGPVVGLTSHVPGMATLALGGAVVNQAPSSAAATQAAITSSTQATDNPYTMYPVGGAGSINIKPWKGNPRGTQSDYVPWKDIYGPDPYSGSPTPDPVPYNYIPIQDIGGGGAIDAGSHQAGGSFRIRGGGTPDSKMIAMRLSPDENVIIQRPNAGKADRAMNVTLNINGNISPLAFVAAEAQVKRAARRIFS